LRRAERARREGTSCESLCECTPCEHGTSYSISEGWLSSTRSEYFRVSVQKLQILVRNRDAHASCYMHSFIFKDTLAYQYLVSHPLPPSLHPPYIQHPFIPQTLSFTQTFMNLSGWPTGVGPSSALLPASALYVTCFTSTKVLALLVQKYTYTDTCGTHLQLCIRSHKSCPLLLGF